MIRCVGGIVHDGRGRLLLIQRAHEPAPGKWTLPGGKVEDGETDVVAVQRELAQECGIQVRVGALAGTVTIGDYQIFDYLCVALNANVRAGDDAAAARWVTEDELTTMDLTNGLIETLAEWDCLPAP